MNGVGVTDGQTERPAGVAAGEETAAAMAGACSTAIGGVMLSGVGSITAIVTGAPQSAAVH
jgi:hypothetical protein